MEMRFHLGETNRAVGDEVVEVIHQFGLGEDWHFCPWPVLEAAMKALVERRPVEGKRPHLRDSPQLTRLNLGACAARGALEAAPSPEEGDRVHDASR